MNSYEPQGRGRGLSHLGRTSTAPHPHVQQHNGHPEADALQTLETLLTIDDQLAHPASGGLESGCGIGSAALKGTGLEFEDLTYTVLAKQKRDGVWVTREMNLLSNITGQAPKGQVTAVMGPSGAGKSTFLDALAGRIASGSLEGLITVEGRPVNSSLMKRISAYVMQDDQLFPMLTVYETLLFAAEVRLPHTMSRDEKKSRVTQLIEQLGLTSAENTYIGNEGHRGISGGERRRVSIGVDIIHGPSLLFLDEPTSGLDSSSAYSVVEKVYDIAMAGSTIVMTIHQPSYKIQMLLNRLIVLARGKLIYQGTPSQLKNHMQALGRDVPKGENPIEFLLDVIQEYDRSTVGLDPLVAFNKDGIKPSATTLQPKATTTPGNIWSAKKSPCRKSPYGRRSPEVEAAAAEPEGLHSPLRSVADSGADDEDDYDRSLTRGSPWVGGAVPKVLASSYYRPLDAGGFPLRTPLYILRTPGRTPGKTPGRTPGQPVHMQMQTPMMMLRMGASRAHRGSQQLRQPVSEIRAATPTPTPTAATPCSSDYETEGPGTYEMMLESGSWEAEGHKFANPFAREVMVLMVRNYYNIYRTPELFLSRQTVLTVMGMMMATLFRRTPVSLQGVTQLLSFVIFTVCLFFFSSNDAVPTFIQERFIFIRESSHNAYRASSYTIAGVITYLPFLAVQALTYTVITWWALNLDGSVSFFWLVLYASLLATNSFVMFISALVPNFILGYAAVIAFTAIFFLTCGYFLPRSQIPPYWLPVHYLSTIKYPYEALLLNQFSHNPRCWDGERLTASDPACALTGDHLLHQLGVGSLSRWNCVLILLAWALLYRLCFYVVLRFNSKNQRK